MGDNLKKLFKSRLLDEMLGSVKAAGAADWSVLVMDAVTTKVMSSNCRISEILDYGISLVDNVAKKREPLPSLSGVYFITPSNDSVRQVIEDFKEKPLYKSAHIFFSSSADPRQLNAIKSSPGLIAHLKTLKEVNLELLTVDRRTFVTEEEKSLQVLFGEGAEASPAIQDEVQLISRRLVTLFASLKEFPAIRFRAAKPPGDDAGAGLESRQLVSQRIAVEVNDRLMPLQRAGVLPGSETCDLIVVDRGFDVVAPIIHEWTYEAMAYDLLESKINGNVFEYQSETQAGRSETKEHLLDERDELWLKLRHQHFAAAAAHITQSLDEFRSKHKAANYKGGGDGSGLDMRGMRSLVQSLPQYREQLARLSVHVEVASSLNRIIDSRRLVDLGKLEQDLVFGDATSKEVINFLSTFPDLAAEDKVRLMMSYVATHPEKLDPTKQTQWQKLAKLSNEDMSTVINLECLGVPVRKRGKSSGLNFGRKRKRAVRKDREPGEGEQEYELSRFVPLLQEILEDLAENKLGTDEYPFVRPPVSPPSGMMANSGPFGSSKGQSVRSNKATVGWAKKAVGAGREDAAQPKGRRVIVFIVGGITRSEMRTVHKLSGKLGRDVLLGGTSIINPSTFMKGLRLLSADAATLELGFA
eukprot:jgi/Botrbrau1/1563/Bobra.0107s0050.1